MNEAILNFTDGKENIVSQWGQDFAEEVLLFMRNKLREYQEETGNLYNLEATPAEGATYRFAKEDQKIFPGIIQAGTPEAPYYTNSSQIPVEHTGDAFEALELQDKLQTKYTGGTVLHLYMGGKSQRRPILPQAGQNRFGKLSPALHYHNSNFLHLPQAWLFEGGVSFLPHLRHGNRV